MGLGRDATRGIGCWWGGRGWEGVLGYGGDRKNVKGMGRDREEIMGMGQALGSHGELTTSAQPHPVYDSTLSEK